VAEHVRSVIARLTYICDLIGSILDWDTGHPDLLVRHPVCKGKNMFFDSGSIHPSSPSCLSAPELTLMLMAFCITEPLLHFMIT
jgi:hypothetical protein